MIILLTGLVLFALNFFSGEKLPYTKEKPESTIIQHSNSIVLWARENLPQIGVLKEDKEGFVYLKVDDGYINQLFPKLANSEYAIPPYFRRPDSPGAHISVFIVGERHRTGEIKELGQKYSFQISHLASVPPRTHKFIVLQVSSPELEQLRKKYGLPPLLKGHEFHITIGEKKERH